MIEGKPLVSVIMIFLNAAAFMHEAIESVLAQTYTEWELVLVDDGSTDESTQIAQAYAAQHTNQVRYIEHPGHQNRGMSASRNAGIQAARGTYIAFLDADDVYLPQKLECQVALLESQPAAAIVYGATIRWYSWTKRPEDQGRDAVRTVGVPPGTLAEPMTLPRLFLQRKAKTPATCSVLIRREAIAAVGGFEERFRGMFEDHAFFYKLLLRYAALIDGGAWDCYRKHPQSHSHVMERRGEHHPALEPNPSYHRFLCWLDTYMTEQGVDDPKLSATLRRELWPYQHPHLYQARRATTRLFNIARSVARRAAGR
jgi:hypothetical protein